MRVDATDLKQEKTRLSDRLQELVEVADSRKRSLTASETREMDETRAELESLRHRIEIGQVRQDRLKAEALEIYNAKFGAGVSSGKLSGKPTDRERRQAFQTWCLHTTGPIAGERCELATRVGFAPSATKLDLTLPEHRAMGSYVAGKGPEAIPEGFAGHVEVAMKAFGAVKNVSRVLQTKSGNPLKYPTINDTTNVGRRLAENTEVTKTDVAISEISLDAYKYSSDIVLVSVELLQDEDIDLERVLGELIGERIGRIVNQELTTGTGDSQPEGVVTASTIAKTVADDASVTYADLIDLQHSVDPAYQGGARWMFNFSTLAALKKMVDGANRPIWQPASDAGMAGEFPGTLLGKPYTINQDMPSMTADAKPILYGDFSKYLVRECKGVQLLRLNERYADYLQVGFLAYYRCDGVLLNAGTNPLKCLRMAGS